MSDWWGLVFIFIIDIVIIFAIVACVFCNSVRDEGSSAYGAGQHRCHTVNLICCQCQY